MSDLLQLLRGHRESQWLHTAAIITHIRLSAGDKQAKLEKYNPYSQSDANKQFKEYMRRIEE